MSHIKDRLTYYNDFMKKLADYHQMIPASDVLKIIEELQDDLEQDEKENGWIPVSDMPNCCGYPVLLTVENKFGQREVCKAFTNYMKEGKQLFYTNEKEYCAELTSSKLSEAWKPIAWMELPERYEEE
ncbi:hypothetical protein [Blautia massiliensis (ex Durand et al. 2017)]|uniref:hypothetical protein n=1 Tax=Blautia massiliensis (ex Durand et al. 2017) TaxID=1737424 RepID=UPI0022E2DC63|nr:hypothetical protein [Blautia massiliensis (ex Durand et al. 2017)]